MNITLPPALRRYVDEQVKRGRYADAGEVVRAAVRRMETQARAGDFQSLGAADDADIEALAFIVMMEAAQSAREDLRDIMNHVKAINAAKQGLRDIIRQVSRDAAANAGCLKDGQALDFARGLGSERAYHRVPLPRLDPDAPGGVRYTRTDLFKGRIKQAEVLTAILEDLKSQLDDLSEMGEMESLRLQMAMDRLSKMMTTLSNLLKKISDTAASITQNIK